MTRKQARGFTLIEFLVTLLVASILIFVAIPGFYTVIQNNKVVSMTNQLSAAFNHARSESIKRSTPVLVCSAGNDAFSACGSDADWVNGWIIFTDEDGNNAIDSSSDVLKVHGDLPEGTNITADRNKVTFDSTGFITDGAFSINLSATGCTGNNTRILSLTPSGHLSISYAAC